MVGRSTSFSTKSHFINVWILSIRIRIIGSFRPLVYRQAYACTCVKDTTYPKSKKIKLSYQFDRLRTSKKRVYDIERKIFSIHGKGHSFHHVLLAQLLRGEIDFPLVSATPCIWAIQLGLSVSMWADDLNTNSKPSTLKSNYFWSYRVRWSTPNAVTTGISTCFARSIYLLISILHKYF